MNQQKNGHPNRAAGLTGPECNADLTRIRNKPPSAFARKAGITPKQAKAILDDLKKHESMVYTDLLAMICKHLEPKK